MCSVPKPHQPPRGALFDTLILMDQNEKMINNFFTCLSISSQIKSIERKCQHWCEINLYKFVISFFQKNGGYHPSHSEHGDFYILSLGFGYNLRKHFKTHSGIMQLLLVCHSLCRQFEETFDNAQWRKGKKWQPVRFCINWDSQFESTLENTQWRKLHQMEPLRFYIKLGQSI